MTVEEMLGRISSAELTSWAAWEQANGPLDRDYVHEALAMLIDVMGSGEADQRFPRPKELGTMAERMREAEERKDELEEQARRFEEFKERVLRERQKK